MGQKSYLKAKRRSYTKNVPKMYQKGGQKGGQKGSKIYGSVVNVKGKSLRSVKVLLLTVPLVVMLLVLNTSTVFGP